MYVLVTEGAKGGGGVVRRGGGRFKVSISCKDGVIISAGHTKNHLQPPKKVPGLKVWVKAQQRDCVRGNKHEKS